MSESARLPAPEKAADDLRCLIISGEFRPGDKLPEAELAARFGVSRNSLREAFRLLGRGRLVEHEPNRGVFVSRPGLSEVVDVFRVRRLIEVDAVRHAAPGHPGVAQMQGCVDTAWDAARRDDWVMVGTADVEFHDAVVRLTDSPILIETFQSLTAQLRLIFGIIGNPRYMHESYIERNAELAELLHCGQQEQAARQMKEYLDDAESQITGALVSGRHA